MRQKIFIGCLVFIMLFSFLIGENPKKIVNNFQEKYKNFEFIEIKYKEIVTIGVVNTIQQTNGLLIMSGKNQFKLTTDDQVMAMDGKNFYRLNKKSNQLTIDYIKSKDEMLFFQKMFFHVTDYYYVNLISEEKIDKNKIFILNLTPKENDDQLFKSIKTWVMDKTYFIPKLELLDLNDNITEYKIINISTDKKYTDNDFMIQAENGMEVIDLRL